MTYFECNRCEAIVMSMVDIHSHECSHCKKGTYAKKKIPSGWDNYTSKEHHNFEGVYHTTISC